MKNIDPVYIAVHGYSNSTESLTVYKATYHILLQSLDQTKAIKMILSMASAKYQRA